MYRWTKSIKTTILISQGLFWAENTSLSCISLFSFETQHFKSSGLQTDGHEVNHVSAVELRVRDEHLRLRSQCGLRDV